MDERDWLAQRFQEHRPRLRAVAYRMLGSTSEADGVGEQRLVLRVDASLYAVDDRVRQVYLEWLLASRLA